jgi:hypothetical protein
MNYLKNLIVIFFLLLTNVIFSQENYDFVGVIQLPDNSIISYRVFFTEIKGDINGFSVTDLQGDHETKSIISGKIDKENDKLTFKESEIIYTKSDELTSDFCFIHFNGKLKLNHSKALIEGSFKGLYNDGVKCTNGSIKLVGEDALYKKVNKLSKKINKTNRISDSIKSSFSPVKMINDLKMNTLKSNNNINVYTTSENYSIKLWDAGKEDGDKIFLYLNGKILMSKYEVVKQVKEIDIKLVKGVNVLKIVAYNNGLIAPNTAKIVITDGVLKHDLSTNLSKGEFAKITIIRK